MAAQINQRYLIPPNINHDNIVYQWVVSDKTRVVSIIQQDGELLICHVFNAISNQFTERPAEELAKEHSWERLIPEIVDTPKGPMCILRDVDEKCYSKSYVKTGQSTIMVWSFYGIMKERIPPFGIKKHIADFLGISLDQYIENEVVSSVILNTITNRSGRWIVNKVQIGKWIVNEACIFPSRELVGELPPNFSRLNMDHCKREIERCDRIWQEFYSIIQNNDEYSILDVNYDEKGIPCSFRRKQLVMKLNLSVEAELDQPDPVSNPRWILSGKEVSLVRTGDQIKYVVRDVETGRGILAGIVKSRLDEEGMRRTMEELSRRCVYFLDSGIPFFANVLRRWSVEGHREIRLMKEKNGINWWLFDRTGSSIQGGICVREYPDYQRHFFYQIREYPAWYDVREYRVDEMAFQDLIASSFSTPPQFSLSVCLGTDQCSAYTNQILHDLLELPVEEQITILSDFKLKRINVYDAEGAKFIQSIVEPSIVQPSRMDERVLLTKFMYAVTLIRMGRIEKKTVEQAIEIIKSRRGMERGIDMSLGEGQHAQLIIEGITTENLKFAKMKKGKIIKDSNGDIVAETVKEGKQFCILADFDGGNRNESNSLRKYVCGTGPAHVEILNYSSRKVLYIERSQTWKRSAKVVSEMFEQIKKERDNPSENLSRDIINKLGRTSVTANDREDSCITWAKEKLAMINVNLSGPVMGRNIVTYTSDFTYPDEYHEQHVPEGHDLL